VNKNHYSSTGRACITQLDHAIVILLLQTHTLQVYHTWMVGGGMGGWVGGGMGLRVGFININDMYNNDVGKGVVYAYEAYEAK
jgi:hypothetical protein